MLRTFFRVAWCAVCVFVLALPPSAQAADPMKAAKTLRRLNVGDLVRFVEGAGSGQDLAEVLAGPDPSNYYLLTGSDGHAISVPRDKLRLVQSAGTKKADFNPGDHVERNLRPRGTERGDIVRVNGTFCEVKTKSADSNWFECKELRRVSREGETQNERLETLPRQ